MLRSILIGLDGSVYSTSALKLGIHWGKQYGALLKGLGIIDKPGVDRAEAMPIGAAAFKRHTDEVQLQQAQAKVQKCLDKFQSECKQNKVRSKIAEEVGTPWEKILEETQRHDLLLLGQQTYFEFENYDAPGQTLHRVLKHTPRPVVTVPKKAKDIGNILIAYDGSLQAAHALGAFCSLEMYRNREINIVSIAEEQSEADHWSTIAADYLGNHRVKSTVHALVSTENPAQILLKLIRKLKIGMFVMGAYGESKLKEFFFGSVTKTLLKEASIPMFLFH